MQIAGNAVKKASDNLVKAAQQSQEQQDAAEAADVEVSSNMVGNIAIEIEAQEAILKKEKELQDARRKLEKIRQVKYKPRGQDN